MENDVVLLDTSISIDFFRKSKKENSFFFKLTNNYRTFAVSTITEFEIYVGSNPQQDIFWNEFFRQLIIYPYDSSVNQECISIQRELKPKGIKIDTPDLMIAATARFHQVKLATLNKKHFLPIEQITIVIE